MKPVFFENVAQLDLPIKFKVTVFLLFPPHIPTYRNEKIFTQPFFYNSFFIEQSAKDENINYKFLKLLKNKLTLSSQTKGLAYKYPFNYSI